MLITLEQVTKILSATFTLEVSLTFADRRTTVILGPSGCGKSTLLRLILRLLLPTQGKIFLNREEITSSNINTWRRQIGYMTQDGGLFPHLTARQNVVLVANYLRYSPSWIEERLTQLMSLLNLSSHLLRLYPSELSGGQKQRISLMRALLLDPDCLLLDEPLGALDPITRTGLQMELKQIFSKLNKTILLVTHDIREAAYFADEIIFMREGRIIQKEILDGFSSQSLKESFIHELVYAPSHSH